MILHYVKLCSKNFVTENPVENAVSRLCRFSSLRVYGLFRPTQKNYVKLCKAQNPYFNKNLEVQRNVGILLTNQNINKQTLYHMQNTLYVITMYYILYARNQNPI